MAGTEVVSEKVRSCGRVRVCINPGENESSKSAADDSDAKFGGKTDITCTAQVQERGGSDEQNCNEPSQKRAENRVLKVCDWCNDGDEIGQVRNEKHGQIAKRTVE